jgi:hypothetical protein
MSENDKPADQTQPVRTEGAAPPAAPEPEAPPAADPVAAAPAAPTAYAAPVERRGFRERLRRVRSADGSRAFSLGALVASALAGVIVGGLGTAVFHAVTDDHDRIGWVERRGPVGRDLDDDRGPMFGGPRGVPGELQPTTPPEDDDSGTSS